MILGIDAAGKTVSAAVYDEVYDITLSKKMNTSSKGHAETLMPLIDEVLKEAKLTLDDISVIGVTAGPGSFTGVRIGVSVVKGLAMPKNILTCGVSSITAAAYNARKSHDLVLSVMSARNKRFYCSLFDFYGGAGKLWEDSLYGYEEILERIGTSLKIAVTGEGAEEFYNLVKENKPEISNVFILSENLFTDAENVCRIAATKTAIPAESLAPFYLGLSQAEQAQLDLERKQAEHAKY